MSTFPQTTYVKSYPAGQLGQLYKHGANTHLKGALPAVSIIQPGDLLEKLFDSGSSTYVVRPAKSATGALVALAGVAIYKSMRQPISPPYNTTYVPGFQIGDMVEFVRQGKIYAKWYSKDGTTAQLSYTSPNYAHSTTSTSSTGPVGAFTDLSTTATTGSEVDACPSGVQIQEDQTATLGFGICLVELSLP